MPSVPSPSALEARRAVAERLKELRIEAGLTGQQLAGACGWHKAKTSRLENARTPPSDDDIRAWCRACGAEEQVADLIAASRSAESMYVEWKRKQRSGLQRLQASYNPLYRQTSRFRVYSPDIVPGFLQRPAYATALLSAITAFRGIPDDVEQAVEARTARSQVLYESHRSFSFLIEESVLRYRIGDRAAMSDQLNHLRSVMSLPTVSLGVIPFSDRRGIWPLEACYIYDDDLVQVELLNAEVSVRAPTEIATYIRAFNELRRAAVYGDRARALIDSASEAFA
ncbi:helix-turn-helix transcriptional regulator [Nocardiopsis sp. RSe5-2]|uniref:Helix-turn-helix transcriptional regulator n=1 Tax=Nocardiopsis endophytica TaxID=3018445 RepID=A0ABT4U1N7_9ACTN|nr:helix-turn-helix transcriptional regulator [Nocardiopsis endophytica]MDA2810872.1 helix-turn-helix transcriptional regulator [Nocardiopsis endophytica]